VDTVRRVAGVQLLTTVNSGRLSDLHGLVTVQMREDTRGFTIVDIGTILGLSVRYGAGRGRFSLARPRPYTGPGGYVSGNPRPAPIRGPPALIPWTGPRLLLPSFNGDLSGVWVGRGPERGPGQGIPKKTPRPRTLSGAGRGKGPGARVFRGTVRPVTNSTRSGTPDPGGGSAMACK